MIIQTTNMLIIYRILKTMTSFLEKYSGSCIFVFFVIQIRLIKVMSSNDISINKVLKYNKSRKVDFNLL